MYDQPDEEDRDDFVLMQFTEILDKNNKEIYEGDIVDYGGSWGKRVICYNDGGFVASSQKRGYWDIKIMASVCEIIGNIYQNPYEIS